MSERYSRLFSLQENLYSQGSPVVIAAGALLKDNESGKVLAQLKLRSISPKTIKATTVSILPYDVAGNPLGDVVEYQYLDIKVTRDGEFGQKTPVVLPNTSTRAYSVTVSEVIFVDNTIWRDDGIEWESIPKQHTLEQRFINAELVKQFRIEHGSKSKYYYQEHKDLWMCACGIVNHCNEEKCHNCGGSLKALRSFDLDGLKASCDFRLAEEKKQAEAAAAAAKAATKKTIKVAAIIVPIIIVAIIAAVAIPKVMESNEKKAEYNSAVSLMESGQYEEAIAAFEAMAGYEDSQELIEACKTAIHIREEAIRLDNYNSAIELFESGQYEDAAALFERLSDYKDSTAYLNDCNKIIAENRIRSKFEGTWKWVAADKLTHYLYYYVYNLYDRYYIDFDTQKITLIFKSPTTEFEETSDFEIINQNVLRCKFFRTGYLYLYYYDSGIALSSTESMPPEDEVALIRCN